MKHYSSVFQKLSSNNIILQNTTHNEQVSVEPVVARKIEQNQSVILYSELRHAHQEIYLHLEQGSSCQLIVNDRNLEQSAAVELYVVVEQGATWDFVFSCISEQSVDCKIHVYLKGDRSVANIKGLYALTDNQKLSLQTYQYHEGADSKSNLMIKGIVKDAAHVSYNGLITIDAPAVRTDAVQEHKTITLSKQAKVVSVPSIEVLQHDVSCCHGTAIGKFNKQDLWYLESKGIAAHKAHELLIESFFQDVVQDMSDKKVLELVCQKLQ